MEAVSVSKISQDGAKRGERKRELGELIPPGVFGLYANNIIDSLERVFLTGARARTRDPSVQPSQLHFASLSLHCVRIYALVFAENAGARVFTAS